MSRSRTDTPGAARRAFTITGTERTAEYLIGTPLLADYLAEGLQQFETEGD